MRKRPRRLSSQEALIAGGIGVVFAIPGVATLIWGVILWANYFAAQEWHEGKASILSVELIRTRHTDDDGTSYTYRVKCTYTYAWDGTKYTVDSVDLTGMGSSDHGFHKERQRFLDEARKTKTLVPVWVNPENPGEAVLYRDRDWVLFFLAPFGLVFTLTGTFMAIFGILSHKAARRHEAASLRHRDKPWLRRADWEQGTAEPYVGKNVKGHWAVALVLLAITFFFSNLLWIMIFTSWPIIPAAIGIGCAIAILIPPIRATFKHLRFGSPSLRFQDNLPLTPGGTLRAFLPLPESTAQDARVAVTVLIWKYHDRLTSGNAAWLDIDYEETWDLDAGKTDRRENETGVLVDIPLPKDRPPTNDDMNRRVIWSLEVRARLGGAIWKGEYDLPVYAP